MSRKDQFLGTLTVDWPGLGPLGTWDARTGGNMDSDSTKYRPGGMGTQESLGGLKNLQNVVLTRRYKTDRDHRIIKLLYAAAGRAPAHYHEVPLDADGNPAAGADVVTWNGVLKRVNMPDRDSQSQDAALIEVEIDVEGNIA